ncbi:MAG: metallophosphoesterase [Methanosarcinaceae archaeon]|nr:metallophosphoesterase [Methanosarcinaceae archaeon]
MRHLKRILLILVFFSSLILPGYSSFSEEKLAITHGPYLLDPAENAVTVVWFTNKKSLSWVEYCGDKSFGTFPIWGGYPKEAKSSSNGLIDANTLQHSIRIKNLEKGTKYKYRVVSKEILEFNPYEVLYGDRVVGEIHEFETLDSEKESFVFGAITDVHERGSELDGLLQNSELGTLDIIFYTGDILNWIGDENRIFDCFLDISVKHFAKEKPFVFIRGNHETRGPNARSLMSYFPHTSGKFYHSFAHGDVFFIILDSGEDKPDTHPVYAGLVDFDAYRAEQAEWLKKEVESEGFKQSLYKVVLVHIPLFSGSSKHGATDLTKIIGPILNNAGIDLMISGHHHRFDIIKNNEKGNRFPVVVLGQDMFLECNVSKERLSIKVTDNEGVIADSFDVKAIK